MQTETCWLVSKDLSGIQTDGGRGSVVVNRVSREDYRNLTADQLRGEGVYYMA